MTELQVKQLAFLNDEIGHFNSTNRSVRHDGMCTYSGVGCALGRHIQDKDLCARLDAGIKHEDAVGVGNDEVFALMPDNLKELGQSFLSDAQSLHDCDSCWNETGLTVDGVEKVERIKARHGLN